jgi:hypothetical protein
MMGVSGIKCTERGSQVLLYQILEIRGLVIHLWDEISFNAGTFCLRGGGVGVGVTGLQRFSIISSKVSLYRSLEVRSLGTGRLQKLQFCCGLWWD